MVLDLFLSVFSNVFAKASVIFLCFHRFFCLLVVPVLLSVPVQVIERLVYETC